MKRVFGYMVLVMGSVGAYRLSHWEKIWPVAVFVGLLALDYWSERAMRRRAIIIPGLLVDVDLIPNWIAAVSFFATVGQIALFILSFFIE